MSAPSRRSPADEGELRVQVPPGWLQLTGSMSEEQATEAFVATLQADYEDLDGKRTAQLTREYHDARVLARTAGFHISGVLPTLWKSKHPTVWFYGLRVLNGIGGARLNPAALIERYLQVTVAGDGESPMDFYAVDGRVGASLSTTLPRPAVPEVSQPQRNRRGTTVISDALGAVVAALPLPGAPADVLLVFGAAPDVQQRSAMAIFASILIHSAHLVGGEDTGQVASLRTVGMRLEDAFGPGRATAAERTG